MNDPSLNEKPQRLYELTNLERTAPGLYAPGDATRIEPGLYELSREVAWGLKEGQERS